MSRPFRSMLLLAILVATICVCAQAAERIDIPFPDVPGYTTLKCDFHMHTVFSDGSVWPTVRVQEAWRNGLDALAITDHIEYLPHEADVGRNFNRPYEIAKPEADKLHLILIRGSEITRDEPHGHFNAIFLTDCNAIDVEDQQDAVRIANEQGAFVFWNHPEWKNKGESVWSDIQQGYLDKGWMKGLEVFNGGSYYPTAHKWAIEKNLTMLANTDIHSPIDDAYDHSRGEFRAMTLVFAKEKSEQGIKEALLARRTVAFSKNTLVGEEQWVRPLFELSVDVQDLDVTLKGKGTFMVGIHNSSACAFDLEGEGRADDVTYPKTLRLPAGKTVLMSLQMRGTASDGAKQVSLPYTVKNIWTGSGESLKVAFDLNVTFVKEG